MEYKKNAVDLTDLALGILILGITVAIGANILIGVRDSQQTSTDTLTTSNESTFINGTTDTLANTWVKSVDVCLSNVTGTGTQAANSTIAAANYSVSIDSIDGIATITNTSASNFNNAACTYTTYDETDPRWLLPNSAATGLAEYGNWFSIIVIVGIAGLILSLIFLAFSNRGGGSSDGGVAY